MTVAIDVVSTGSQGAGVASITWNHTCSGSNRLLVVAGGIGGATSLSTVSATYNGVTMSTMPLVNSNNASDGGVQLYYMVAPPTGSHAIVITNSIGTRDLGGGSISFTGVNQISPLQNFNSSTGNSSTPSVTVASGSGNLVVDAVATGHSISASGQTLQWNQNINPNSGAGNSAQSTAVGASSVTMSYTMSATDWWSMIGASVVAATANAPAFIAKYSTASYATTGSSKTATVTTQAGDNLVVYAGGANEIVNLSGISGNGISFTLQQSDITTGFTPVYIWTGTDNTGGTNWTLTINNSNATQQWGFSCLVFRNSGGFGASTKAQGTSGAPTLTLTTAQANSAVVVFNGDWNAVNGSSRTWYTVNGVTPSNANGLETTYSFSSGQWTAYGAYYSNAGPAKSITIGLSAPGAQKYNIAAIEVLGVPGPVPPTTAAWL